MTQFASPSRRAAALPAAQPQASHDHIPFDSGHAFPGILPDLSGLAQRVLASRRAEMLQYGEREGLPEMRQWIAAYLKDEHAAVAPEEVLVVNGAKHGIDLICRLLLDEGDSIVVTSPTYFTAIPIFRSFGVQFIEVGQDAEGMQVERIAEAIAWLQKNGRAAPKFIYNIPEFHNPTGATMTRRRREALLELAGAHGIYVVEDSPYRHLRFEGASEPTLKSLDRGGLVLHVGTFSKLLAPGLRIGWVAGKRDLIHRMALLKSDGGTSPLVQRLIVEYLAEGGQAAHARLAQSTYRAHRDRMLAALARELPEFKTRVPQGGYYLWIDLPGNADAEALASRARDFGVSIFPGSKFYAAQKNGWPGNALPEKNHIRLTFSHAGLDEIEEGVRRLAAAWSSLSR
jgi:2-aminoadipate transaminase